MAGPGSMVIDPEFGEIGRRWGRAPGHFRQAQPFMIIAQQPGLDKRLVLAWYAMDHERQTRVATIQGGIPVHDADFATTLPL
jgi:hypothetical protein